MQRKRTSSIEIGWKVDRVNTKKLRRAAKVLVVDDNEDNCLLAQRTLEDEGYRVVLARGGAEGIAAFKKEQPDCVLLDVRMPDVDGFAVCEAIRALPACAETPILFLTAQRDVDTFDHALRAGGVDFLTKPVRPTELLLRVEGALKLLRLNVKLRKHYALLKQHRDDLQRLQLQKERLMQFVVHDLKNPVSAMDLHAQVLLRSRELPADARESVARIRAGARQLTRMIVNLLDVSKADEGQLAPKSSDFSLPALVDDVLAELSVNAGRRKVTFKCSLEVEQIHADQDLLRRALTNLVENAIRYAPAETSVTVTAAAHVDAIELRVTDAGTGIAADMREKVFDPFVQVESGGTRARALAGHGLGLSFCKAAIEAHRGRIWVEDAKPGSTFCVSLPHAC